MIIFSFLFPFQRTQSKWSKTWNLQVIPSGPCSAHCQAPRQGRLARRLTRHLAVKGRWSMKWRHPIANSPRFYGNPLEAPIMGMRGQYMKQSASNALCEGAGGEGVGEGVGQGGGHGEGGGGGWARGTRSWRGIDNQRPSKERRVFQFHSFPLLFFSSQKNSSS
jgi:hypothetical protein